MSDLQKEVAVAMLEKAKLAYLSQSARRKSNDSHLALNALQTHRETWDIISESNHLQIIVVLVHRRDESDVHPTNTLPARLPNALIRQQ